jgi:hypothetical protein
MALVDDGRVVVEAGDSLRILRGSAHRLWNQGDAEVVFDAQVRPASDLDRYLQAYFEVLNAGPPDGPSSIYLAHVLLRHRHTQAVSLLPGLLQTAVFRLMWVFGTLFGRYRGDEWPGAPGRCGGAPLIAGDESPRQTKREP